MSVADVIYGEESIINIIADIDGKYAVNINGARVTVNVKGGKGNNQTKLSHGNYITETTFADNNYDSIVNEASFEVKKSINNVILNITDVVYGNFTVINVIADVDGNYTIYVDEQEITVTVIDGKGQNALPQLAGNYTTNTIFNNPNYDSNITEATYSVLKANVTISIIVLDTTYPFEVNGTVYANVDREYNVTVGNYSTVVTI